MATHYPAPTTEELQDVRFARVKRPSVDENSGEGQVSGPGYWFPKGEKNGNLISLREDEIEVFRRRYRHYIRCFHDRTRKGVIRLHSDLFSRLSEYDQNERETMRETLLKIWSIMTYTMDKDTTEVDIERAVENYIKCFHSMIPEVREQGRQTIIRIAEAFFNRLDTDKDGVISINQWMRHYSMFTDFSFEECQKWFSQIDTNGEGVLVFSDMLETVSGFFTKTTPQYYELAFGKLDMD